MKAIMRRSLVRFINGVVVMQQRSRSNRVNHMYGELKQLNRMIIGNLVGVQLKPHPPTNNLCMEEEAEVVEVVETAVEVVSKVGIAAAVAEAEAVVVTNNNM
jgi:hypothetical protein